MCKRPQDWRWSSYAGTVGLEREDGRIDSTLILGSVDGGVAALRALVEGV
jgi:hypothetical protein